MISVKISCKDFNQDYAVLPDTFVISQRQHYWASFVFNLLAAGPVEGHGLVSLC